MRRNCQIHRSVDRFQLDGRSRKLIKSSVQAAIHGRKIGPTRKIMRIQSSVYARSAHIAGDASDVERAIDQLNFVESYIARHRQRVLDARRIVAPSPVESQIVVSILGANGKIILARVDIDARLGEAVFRLSILHCVYLDFILIPDGNVNRAVDVVQLHPAIRTDVVGLMKLLGEVAAMIRSVGCERENDQCADGTQNGSGPGFELTSAVHWLSSVSPVRRGALQMVRLHHKGPSSRTFVYESYLGDVPFRSQRG